MGLGQGHGGCGGEEPGREEGGARKGEEPQAGRRAGPWREEVGAAPHLQVPVDHEAVVHVLQAQNDFRGVEAHVGLGEDPVLGQVVVQVPA